MGCACSKGIILPNEHRDQKSKLRKSSKRFVSSSSFKRDEVVVEADGTGNDATALLITSSPTGDIDGEDDDGEKKKTKKKKKKKKKKNAVTAADKSSKNLQRMDGAGAGGEEQQQDEEEGQMLLLQSSKFSSIGRLPHGDRGALVVAGWPSWLSSVAGEAINGWIPRSADSFEKLEKIGQGTYSSVYKARDLETNKLVALKKVRFANMDPESVRFMAREIIILRRLDHPNIMKLEALITSRVSSTVSLVFEYMEHDLTGLAVSPGVSFSEAQIKCYMQQLLRGLEHCHKHGVLHRDIKGANLLIDNHGNLKIGDFGLATTFIKSHHQKQQQPMTSRVVTLWYRPPELLLGSTDYGPSVDLWSAGCILAELFAGKPIMPGRTEVEQLHKIFKLCGSPSEEYWKKSKLPHATIFKPQQPYNRCLAQTFKDFPSSTLALLDFLLAVEPDDRGSAFSALQHEFFTTKPLPLDPSSLPKYSPSKEFDAKLRDEENRRRKVAAGREREHVSFRKNPKESRALPVVDANAEKQQGQNNPKSSGMSDNGKEEEEEEEEERIKAPRRGAEAVVVSRGARRIVEKEDDSSSSSSSYSYSSSCAKRRSSNYMKGAHQLSKFSNSVAVGRLDSQGAVSGRDTSSSHLGSSCEEEGRRYGQEWSSHHLLLSYKDQQNSGANDSSTLVYSPPPPPVKKHLHCSGPLLRPGGNMDEILKQHERQIRNAIRKARLDKSNTNNAGFTETESFLLNTQNVIR